MITLPTIFSDGMVIEKNAKIWGKADANETVRVIFLGKTYETTADEKCNWEVHIEADNFGGPYELTVGDMCIKDVMVGYVWLCSGQSNMETPISRVKIMFKEELKNVNYPNIRAFLVTKAYDFNTERQLEDGKWTPATNEYIDNFFAVSYFFAVKLWNEYGVPIGLINTAAGGSTAEAWISETALKPFPRYKAILEQCKEPDFVSNTERTDLENIANWHKQLNKKDIGKLESWESTEYDDSSWDERELTENWEKDLSENGSVWFRKTIEIPSSVADKPATLFLGRIIDSNHTYINGKLVGRIEYQYPPSVFSVASNILHEGKNTIAVRVVSNNGFGGFADDKPYKLVSENYELDLLGKWKYKRGAVMPPAPQATFFYVKPTGLYNAMLAPVIGYSITGAIWYQGESNTNYPDNYKNLMEALINEWREKWGKNIPFIFTQLTSFEAKSATYPNSKWAELREQQLKCLEIENTAMAVTIDCGEPNDLHPLDKKTVGERLSLAARKLAYKEDIIYSGPIVNKIDLYDHKILISFKHTADGLLCIGDNLNCFEIETYDGICQKVKAVIFDHDVVAIDCSDIGISTEKPFFVRYAWADSPIDANLYNSEKLPASPFREIVS